VKPRLDFKLISHWVPTGARVLDLGCGSGELLRQLADHKGCRIQGLEMEPEAWLAAAQADVPVLQLDIDHDLDWFTADSYDLVILSRTLQSTRFPGEVLRQMLRIAPTAIVSMPNFAYWRNRLRLLAGRAPRSKDLPYHWHDSPNFHFGSLHDLEDLFRSMSIEVERRQPLSATGRLPLGPLPNWSAGSVIYQLGRPDRPVAMPANRYN
jgi:methionine biosynthesis protein MetW